MIKVAGYTYQTEVYCLDCMHQVASRACYQWGDATDYRSTGTVDVVTAWALNKGIDHRNERSYDGGDFPKVVLSHTDDAEGKCDQPGCGQTLLDCL